MTDVRHAVQLLGASMRFKATGDDHFAAELVAEPGFSATPHIHRTHEELFYVLEGEFEFLVQDEVVRLTEGSFVAVPAGVVHDFRNPGPGTARLLGIATPGGFHAYFDEIAAHVAKRTLSMASLRELRLRYDTQHVDLVWSS